MKIVNKKLELARQDLKTDERIFNPVLEAHVTGGMKSGYEPKVNDLKWNYGAGATLTAPIYVSNRSKQKSLGKAQINKSIANIDLIKKEITSQVADSYLTLISAKAKIEQLIVQRDVSERAYKQAMINYSSGAITNLELLTASTNAINSELYLLQEKITYQIAYYQLLVNIGVNLVDMFDE